MPKVDPSIYKLAGEFADVVRAHAIVESGENPEASYGDGGRAFGILQQHMAFVKDYIRFADIKPSDTVSEGQVKIAAAFYNMHRDEYYDRDRRDLLIQSYNKGYVGVFGVDRLRAPKYLADWHEAMNQIKAKNNTTKV